MAEVPFDFAAIRQYLRKVRLIIASDKPDVQKAAKEDEIDLAPLVHEPQTRQFQLSQALLEAIADDLLKPGDRIVALYPVYERSVIDSVSLVNLSEHLAKLTARDLRRLEQPFRWRRCGWSSIWRSKLAAKAARGNRSARCSSSATTAECCMSHDFHARSKAITSGSG